MVKRKLNKKAPPAGVTATPQRPAWNYYGQSASGIEPPDTAGVRVPNFSSNPADYPPEEREKLGKPAGVAASNPAQLLRELVEAEREHFGVRAGPAPDAERQRTAKRLTVAWKAAQDHIAGVTGTVEGPQFDPALDERLRKWFNSTPHEMGKEQFDSLIAAARGVPVPGKDQP